MTEMHTKRDIPVRLSDINREFFGKEGAAMSPAASLALVVLFGAVLVLPLARWIAPGPDARLDENRNLSPAPDFRHDPLQDLPKKIDAYYNDHVGFRGDMVRIAAVVEPWISLSSRQEAIFGKSPAPGEPGWLYYSNFGILEDRLGLRPLSRTQLESWKQRLERRNAWLAERKILYRFIVVPEKSTIYPEYLPDYMQHHPAATTRLDQLIRYLHDTHSPVQVIDLRDALRAAKPDGFLYFPYDTHWNGRGFFAGSRGIVESLRKPLPDLKPEEFGQGYEIQQKWGTSFQDLRSMLGLPRTPEYEPLLARSDRRKVRLAAASWPEDVDPAPPGIEVYALEHEGAHRRLLMFHDSFFAIGRLARQDQPLAANFSRSFFLGLYPADGLMKRFVELEQPDVVLEERVERELTNIELDPGREAITPRIARVADAPTYYIDSIGGVSSKGATMAADRLTTLRGWAVNNSASATSGGVEIAIDNIVLPAAYGFPRQDVVTSLRCGACLNSGFEVEIPPGMLTRGAHTLFVRVISEDRKSYAQDTFGRVVVR